MEKYRKNRFFYRQMQKMYNFKGCDEDPWFSKMDLCKNQDKFDVVLKNFFERTGNEMGDLEKWTPSGALFFIFTLSTSLGYGNLHPITQEGKVFTMLFAVVSIPLMGYCLALVATLLLQARRNWGGPLQNDSLLFGCFVFFALITVAGALLYSVWLEPSWTFIEGLYFSACTLMTIGFGDYAPTGRASQLFTVFYIFFGLGVASTFIALLTRKVEEKIRLRLDGEDVSSGSGKHRSNQTNVAIHS